MNLRTTLVSFLLLVLLIGCKPAEQPTVVTDANPTAETATAVVADDPIELMETEGLLQRISTLSSDEFGGRAPMSEGEKLTLDYLEAQFREMGLDPMFGDSYRQPVPLVAIEASGDLTLGISDIEGKPVMSYANGPESAVWTTRVVEKTGLDNSELVWAGYGIIAPEYGWNDYDGLDVTGKTVIVLVNDPGYATQNPELFNGNAMTYYGRWDYKFDEAARQGAAGAIMIHDRLPAAYGWPTVINSWTGRKFGMVLPDKGAKLASLESWITRDSAEALFTKAGLNLDEMYEKAHQRGFKPVAMGLNASVALVNNTETINSRNVAAILRGSEAPDEIFIYMAHWDHFGTDPKLEGDQIYNGALDNASGTAALLEIARAYSALPQAPRRSVLFLSVTAEEQGLLGSLYYAANPLFPLANTVGGINIDGMNNFGSTRDITVVGLGMSDLDNYLAAAAAAQERVVEGDREAEKGFYYRSDHFELAKEGVPMLYPSGGYDDREKGVAYGMEKAEEYIADDYHRVSDEYDLSWVVSGALEDMEMYFKTGLDIANSDDWPNWKEGTEFRATRDAQR